MTPANIGWTISIILWLVFIILNYTAHKNGETELELFSLILELVCLGFAWIFLGFSYNWW